MHNTRVLTAACWLSAAVALATGCASGGPPPRPPNVVGLADFHSHQFADLGFGGVLHSHDTSPDTACRKPLTYDKSTFRVRDLTLDGVLAQTTAQAKDGQCYPTWNNLSGQQMDENMLRRAYLYGLRLQVVLAVNSEFLCAAAHLGSLSLTGPRTSACLDPPAIDAQLQAAHDLEKKIDAQAGGPGKGWYRIVTTPAQARQVINDGKLAVVLGIEAANAYGTCRVYVRGNTPSIPPIIGTSPPEATYGIDCGEGGGAVAGPIGGLLPGFENWPQAFAAAYFEHYWDQGARHFFLIHNLPGIAGGNSLSIPLMHATSNPSRVQPGGIFNRVDDVDRVLNAVRPPITSSLCDTEFDGNPGRCDAAGLSRDGFALARLMGDYGAILDIDHLSLRAKNDLRGEQGLGVQYPLISSHSGFRAISHGDQNNEDQLTQPMVDDLIKWGGAFGPILHQGRAATDISTFPPGTTVAPATCGGTTEAFVQSYRYIVTRLAAGTRANGTPAFIGVGYGSDFNGLATWPAPRFSTGDPIEGSTDLFGALTPAFIGGSSVGPSGRCYLAVGGVFPATPAHVAYPFTVTAQPPATATSGPDGAITFGRSSLPWSGRQDPYDISSDGVAHVGMIPDFVEELKAMGLTDAALAPLWNGAEAYIRLWEETNAWAGNYTSETGRGVRDTCRAARAQLVSQDKITNELIATWRSALQTIRQNDCVGAPAPAAPRIAVPRPLIAAAPASRSSIPDVTARTPADAARALTGVGLLVRNEPFIAAGCRGVGTVVAQTPQAGTPATVGATVTLRIGARPRPPISCP